MYKHYFLNEDTMRARVVQTDKRIVFLTGNAARVIIDGDLVYTDPSGNRAFACNEDITPALNDSKHYALFIAEELSGDVLTDMKHSSSNIVVVANGMQITDEHRAIGTVISTFTKFPEEEL